ncbi:MAG: DUF721 domain-containing protein [Rhodospirillaceae bacterium]|nr:DUF721 domain-containing protein [Rhodospirillaceae bacterium]
MPFFTKIAYDADMKKAAPQPPAPPRRRRRPHPLGMAVAAVVRPIVGRKGFVEADILTRWSEIAGTEIATHSRPQRLSKPRSGEVGGPILLIRVASAPFATLLRHQETELCDRINRYFGFIAVTRVKIVLGSLPLPPPPPEPPAPLPPLSAEENALIATVDDPDLRTALENLGRSIRGRNCHLGG